jgi:hypothetical protein
MIKPLCGFIQTMSTRTGLPMLDEKVPIKSKNDLVGTFSSRIGHARTKSLYEIENGKCECGRRGRSGSSSSSRTGTCKFGGCRAHDAYFL